MVQVSVRKMSVHVQPGEAVTEIIFVFYTDLPIAGDAVYTSRTVADFP